MSARDTAFRQMTHLGKPRNWNACLPLIRELHTSCSGEDRSSDEKAVRPYAGNCEVLCLQSNREQLDIWRSLHRLDLFAIRVLDLAAIGRTRSVDRLRTHSPICSDEAWGGSLSWYDIRA